MQRPSEPADTAAWPLRVGLLIDSFQQPAWVRRMVEEIRGSGVAELSVVVRNLADPYPPPKDTADKVRRLLKNLVYQMYMRVDERHFREEPDPFRMTDLRDLLGDLPVVEVMPRMTRYSDFFEHGDIARIREHDLDVALRLGFRILKGDSLKIAKHGVWSYHHGDNLRYRGGPAGFWEVMEDHPVTGSILQILTEELDNGRAIYRSHASTVRLSVWRNRANYYWKTAAFVPRKLRDLHAEGERALEDPLSDAYLPYSARLYRTPTNRQALGTLSGLAGRYVRAKANDLLYREQWFLAWKLGKVDGGAHAVPDGTLYNFKRLVPPSDRFWADPFAWKHEDRHYVFFEELIHASDKGRILAMEIGRDGPGEPAIALERDYHLSFPNVFTWQDRLYMVPETAAAGRLEIYECIEFPHRWELRATDLDGMALLDPVMLERNGQWWLFAGIHPYGSSSSAELHLFHGPSPLGPWTPHRRNPVKSDVRSSRPAGRIFTLDGRHFRPAQDCSRCYGYAISMNEIVRLDEEGYEEREVSRILPTWAPALVGTHTINAAGALTVVDGLAMRRRWSRRGSPTA